LVYSLDIGVLMYARDRTLQPVEPGGWLARLEWAIGTRGAEAPIKGRRVLRKLIYSLGILWDRGCASGAIMLFNRLLKFMITFFELRAARFA
jgi:hypothetical protein